MTEDMENPMEKSTTPTWIVNEHGVKSCWPKDVAIKMIQQNYGWKFCEPSEIEEVPTRKQYPIGMGELTASGLQRRLAAAQSQEAARNMPPEQKKAEIEAMSLSDLRTRAKRLGIDKYWVKSEARLLQEVQEKELA